MKRISSASKALRMVLLAAALAIPNLPGAEVIISEFMASNGSTLKDNDGDYSDWIELNNVSSNRINLLNWSLTDSAGNLNKWRFPAVTLAPNQFLLVYASGKNRIEPTRPLHTNFKLGAGGSYLALVRPDGVTVESQFSPAYPQQFQDVSYGYPILVTNYVLLPANASLKWFVPTNDIGANWIQTGYDDSGWSNGVGVLGYDTGAADPGEGGGGNLAILAKSPLVYYRFGETSGTVAANTASNVNNGIYNSVQLGSAGPQPPPFLGFEANNSAAQFNGSSSFVAGPAGLLNNLGAFTIAGWVNPAVTPGSRIGLFGQNDCVEFGFISGLTLELWTPGGGSVTGVSYPFPLNTWHYVVGVADGTNIKIYLDGNLAATGGSATANYGSSAFGFNWPD
jgi:hypothetical protein